MALTCWVSTSAHAKRVEWKCVKLPSGCECLWSEQVIVIHVHYSNISAEVAGWYSRVMDATVAQSKFVFFSKYAG